MATPFVALAVVLAVVLWPGGPDGAGGGSDGSGGGSLDAAAARGGAAAQTLDTLPGVRLSMVYVPTGDSKPVTRADMTVTARGKATGTLEMPVTGSASMTWSDDQLYLKGDNDFWAQQGPHYGRDLTSSGHWVAPEQRSGYYMLDSFGVNAGSLTPKSLASVVREVTSDPSVAEEDAGSTQGHKATAYTVGATTVVLTSEAPHEVLSISLNPHDDVGGIKTASWPRPANSPAVASPAMRVNAADDARYYNPYLTMKLKPATDEQTAAVQQSADEGAAAAVPPATSEEKAEANAPSFEIDMNSPSLCTTKPCTYSVTVTNKGDEAAEATLYLNFPGIPERVHPLGTLEARGGYKTVEGTRPNIAAPGKRVRHTDYAWVYSPVVYGPDPEVAKRLWKRQLKPSDVHVAAPLKPVVAKLLDLMTKHADSKDTETNAKAVEALQGANQRGQLPLLAAVAASGRLANPQDLAKNVSAANTLGNARVLEQVAHLLRTDPNAKVTYDGDYMVDGEAYRTDYIYTSSQDAQDIKRAVQVKTIEALKHLGTRVHKGAETLNGEGKGEGRTGKPEEAPPGFERVLQLNLEPTVGWRYYPASTAELEEFLKSRKFAQARRNLCKPNGGGSRVDRLVIVNATGIHEWTDLTKLGVHCQ
ncbi:hypothetical protein [Nocardiopsis rhodophaea]|uniref:hypothetical protein n=1 Tax=Nocardiopsis rhodophaea TaxID=280238 RepID=UPI0031D54371